MRDVGVAPVALEGLHRGRVGDAVVPRIGVVGRAIRAAAEEEAHHPCHGEIVQVVVAGAVAEKILGAVVLVVVEGVVLRVEVLVAERRLPEHDTAPRSGIETPEPGAEVGKIRQRPIGRIPPAVALAVHVLVEARVAVGGVRKEEVPRAGAGCVAGDAGAGEECGVAGRVRRCRGDGRRIVAHVGARAPAGGMQGHDHVGRIRVA